MVALWLIWHFSDAFSGPIDMQINHIICTNFQTAVGPRSITETWTTFRLPMQIGLINWSSYLVISSLATCVCACVCVSNGYFVCWLVGGHVLAVLPLVRSLKLADFTMRYAYTEFPCNFFFCFLLCFIILCFRPKFSVVSVSIFIGFFFFFWGWGKRRLSRLSRFTTRMTMNVLVWGVRSAHCGKNYRVGMRTKWNETKIEREKQQQQHELNGVRVCVESVYLVVCLSRGTAKTLERCRQRYTIGAIGTSHTTRQFVFGWVVSEPPLEFIFREWLQR